MEKNRELLSVNNGLLILDKKEINLRDQSIISWPSAQYFYQIVTSVIIDQIKPSSSLKLPIDSCDFLSSRTIIVKDTYLDTYKQLVAETILLRCNKDITFFKNIYKHIIRESLIDAIEYSNSLVEQRKRHAIYSDERYWNVLVSDYKCLTPEEVEENIQKILK